MGRQLWWGHRIPAWYCPDDHITITDQEAGPPACSTCGRPAAELRQETDIFDTWFSSGLWPFSTLGWPDQTPDLARFYPTSVMETGYDIIFFWVARMMMLGLFLTGAEPFHTIYLHGLVRAEGGVKMGKTKGNTVDPIEVIDEIGADALRFALTVGTSPGSDQRLAMAKLDGARNFTNKLWNAARYVLGARPALQAPPEGEPTPAERWIASRLAETTDRVTRQLDELELSAYAGTLFEFTWNDFCDRFVEMSKVDLRRPDATDGERSRSWLSAVESLAGLLRLLHPILPFVTEEIWATLYQAVPEATRNEPLLMSAAWPSAGSRDPVAEAEMELVGDLVRAVRNLRTEAGVEASAWVGLTIAPANADAEFTLRRSEGYLAALCRARPIEIRPAGEVTDRPQLIASVAAGSAWLGADPGGDAAAAARRAAHEDELRNGIDRLRSLLAGDFARRAPSAVVERERKRLHDLETQLRAISRDR